MPVCFHASQSSITKECLVRKKIHKIWPAFSLANEISPQKTMHLVTTTTHLPHLLGFRDKFRGRLCSIGSSHSYGFDRSNHCILKATLLAIYTALFYKICFMNYSYTDVFSVFTEIYEWRPMKQSFSQGYFSLLI